MNELEVDIYQLDRDLKESFLGRFALPAKYSDAVGDFVVTHKSNSQVVKRHPSGGFFITIF